MKIWLYQKKKNNQNNKDSSLIIPDPNDPYFLSDDKSERHNSMYSLYQSDYYVKRKLEKKKFNKNEPFNPLIYLIFL